MEKSSFQVITDFLSANRKELTEYYLLTEYTKTAECQLRESNPNFIDIIRKESLYFYEETFENKKNEDYINVNACAHYAELRFSLGTSFNEINKMHTRYYQALIAFIREYKLNGVLEVSDAQILDYTAHLFESAAHHFYYITKFYLNCVHDVYFAGEEEAWVN